VPKTVELRRHTASDGDVLSREGIEAAVEIGTHLHDAYEVLVSSGAQRATQTLACFLVGGGLRASAGVIVDDRFRSEVEDRWKEAYGRAGAGDLESFRRVDPELVEKESMLLASALRDVFDQLTDGGRALVVGHSPMQEAAIFGLTGTVVEPLSKGAGVVVTQNADDSYEVYQLHS
jgi:broad specificity phosphatase PhoE